jgi:hypothetical protein
MSRAGTWGAGKEIKGLQIFVKGLFTQWGLGLSACEGANDFPSKNQAPRWRERLILRRKIVGALIRHLTVDAQWKAHHDPLCGAVFPCHAGAKCVALSPFLLL